MMNFRLAQPPHLVDLNFVEELVYIAHLDGVVAIGAMARQSVVESSAGVRRRVPLLGEALALVGHPPTRHRGTVVGSIAHADPAAELPSVAVALDARVTLVSAGGTRTVPAAEFFLGPFDTAHQPDEFVTEVSFPETPPGTGVAFVEFSRRHGDFAVAGAAATLRLAEGAIAEASVVLCGVGPRPIRAEPAESALLGERPGPELLRQAAERAVEGLRPPSDLHGSSEYRRDVARVQVHRAVAGALSRAEGAGQ
jgi:carbon-monoxide dehydrogenase medium subunit